MKQFTFAEYTLHFTQVGSGEPLLFLHGFLEDHSIWNEVAAAFNSDNHSIYLIDLPCHGKSRFNGEICSMEANAMLLDQFIRAEKLENPFVFGHSMGGYVGLSLAKIRAIRLTLVHSNFWADSTEKKNERDRVIEIVLKNKLRLINESIPNLFAPENRKTNNSIIKQLVEKASQLPSHEIIACIKGMQMREDLSELMNNQIVTMIQGEHDPIIPMSLLNDKLAILTTTPVVQLIENCGHMSMWENPSELINCLKRIVFS